MPGNINAAAPTEVMPFALCAAFSEEHRIEAYINSYIDGSSDRAALALNSRRFFKMTNLVTAAQYSALLLFYKAHLVKPFWFYNLFETVPKFHWTGDGSAPDGRYAVVFDGSWSDETRMGRSHVSLGLREVA